MRKQIYKGRGNTMRKLFAIFICLTMIFSSTACNNNVKFTETENKTIVANDGTEYTFVGNAGMVWCFGEWDFIGHVAGEKKTFNHISSEIKTGMYSVNGSQDVLVRYLPDNEFASIYIKSDLLKTEIALDNCIRFEFVKSLLSDSAQISNSKIIFFRFFMRNHIKKNEMPRQLFS